MAKQDTTDTAATAGTAAGAGTETPPPDDAQLELEGQEGQEGAEGQEGQEGTEEDSYTPFSDRIEQMRKELEDDDEEEELEDPDAPEGEEAEGEGEEAAAAKAEGEGEEAAEGEEGEDDDVVFIKLPARRQGDPDFEFPVDVEFLEAAGLDPAEAVERLNQLRNGAMYRAEFEEAQTAVQSQQDELDGIYEDLSADPAGFILEAVNPETRTALAEQILTSLDQESFTALARKLDGWRRSPEQREAARAKAEVERLRGEKKRQTDRATSQQTTQNVRAVQNAITGLIPEGMDDARADLFVRSAASELRRHVADNKLTTLEPAEVPEILGSRGVLEVYGITVDDGEAGAGEAAAAEAPPQETPSKNGQTARKKTGQTASSKSKAKGADVRERLKRRKASASTPAGAGSAAPTGFQKVQGETYKERRNRLARAIGLPEKKTAGD